MQGEFYQGNELPERVDAVDAPRHVLAVVDVCRLRVKDLRRNKRLSKVSVHWFSVDLFTKHQ